MKVNDIVKFNNIKYQVLKFLERGTYKSAFLCENIKNKQQVVIFNQISNDTEHIELFKSEIDKLNKIIKKFKGKCLKNIICPIFIRKPSEKKKGVIITNYFKGRDLYQFLYEDKIDYSLIDSLFIMKNLADAILQLHDIGIVHMDIKPENIMIDPESLEVYIIDLGISCEIHDLSCELSGTIMYLPPEYYKLQKRNRIPVPESLFKFDTWAIGCVFFELLVKRALIPTLLRNQKYSTNDVYNLMIYIESSDFKFYDTIKYIIGSIHYQTSVYTQEAKINNEIVNKLITLVSRCLKIQHKDRYTISQIQEILNDIFNTIENNPYNNFLNDIF